MSSLFTVFYMTNPPEIDIDVSDDAECPFCHGCGWVPHGPHQDHECDMCGGSGQLVIISNLYDGADPQ